MRTLPTTKDITSLIISKWSAQGIKLVAGLITVKALGPKDYGLWSMLGLIFVYGALSGFGIEGALRRQIPYLKGKKDEVLTTINTAFSLVGLGALLTSLIIFSLSFLFQTDLQLMNSLRITAVIFLLYQFLNFLKTICQGEGKFVLLSKSAILYSFLYLLLVIFFVRKFRIYGLFFSMFVSACVSIIYLLYSVGLRINFRIYSERFIVRKNQGED